MYYDETDGPEAPEQAQPDPNQTSLEPEAPAPGAETAELPRGTEDQGGDDEGGGE